MRYPIRTLLLACMFFAAVSAMAAVERVDIVERSAFAPGVQFGAVGAYEKIRGVAHFAVDPAASSNRRVVDLELAPRDARGLVTFESEFVVLRPVRARDSTLLYDVNNRGSIGILGQINGRSPAHNDPTTAADAGDGFLMRHGFTLVFSAWTWDVAPQDAQARPLVFKPPVARGEGGMPITAPIANEFLVDAPTHVVSYAGLRGLTYEPAVWDDPAAVLTERARPDDPRSPIDRARWHFVGPEQPGGPGRIQLDGAFQPGTLYEVRYTAKDPYVAGTGLIGIRDLLAWLREHALAGAPVPKRALIFGISQSGRVIGRMLYDGFDVDERGRLAFDGAFLDVPGAGGSAGFNSRFAQPTRHPSMLEEHDYPADAFPFTTVAIRDPVTGETASRLDRAQDAKGRTPKIMIANTSTEYWNREASLNTTTPTGDGDVAPAPGVRVYSFMGAQHYVGRSHTREPYVDCVSTTDHYLPMRALILGLERWVKSSVSPPASAYPTLADGTLVSVADYRSAFPGGVALPVPAQALAQARLDFGPRFATEGIASQIPPAHGALYETRVPAPDRDGNDRSGVRLVELTVPLGTHTGWNPRATQTGFPWATARFDGSFLPFARTAEERRATGDSRPSLAERYPTRDDFVGRVRNAARQQIAAGFLLPEDLERSIAENTGLYDRILARDPADPGCSYLFAN